MEEDLSRLDREPNKLNFSREKHREVHQTARFKQVSVKYFPLGNEENRESPTILRTHSIFLKSDTWASLAMSGGISIMVQKSSTYDTSVIDTRDGFVYYIWSSQLTSSHQWISCASEKDPGHKPIVIGWPEFHWSFFSPISEETFCFSSSIAAFASARFTHSCPA